MQVLSVQVAFNTHEGPMYTKSAYLDPIQHPSCAQLLRTGWQVVCQEQVMLGSSFVVVELVRLDVYNSDVGCGP